MYSLALSFNPNFITEMLKKWDFRFAAFGVALISFAFAVRVKSKQDKPE